METVDSCELTANQDYRHMPLTSDDRFLKQEHALALFGMEHEYARSKKGYYDREPTAIWFPHRNNEKYCDYASDNYEHILERFDHSSALAQECCKNRIVFMEEDGEYIFRGEYRADSIFRINGDVYTLWTRTNRTVYSMLSETERRSS